MSDRKQPTGTAVFVDQTGRRRRLLRITGGVVGTLAFVSVATVVGGLFTGTPLSVIGWPGDGSVSPAPVTTTKSARSAKPAPSTEATAALVGQSPTPKSSGASRPTVSSQPRVTSLPGGSEKAVPRPTKVPSTASAPPSSEPTMPEQSSEPTAPEQSPEPVPGQTEPPGRGKTAPGHNPDKSTGSKK